MTYSLDVPAWTTFLRSLDGLVLALFLKALAHELRRRSVMQWRVVSDIADDVHDAVQLAARRAADPLHASVTPRALDAPVRQSA